MQNGVQVPRGMSCVNAFYALWKISRPLSLVNEGHAKSLDSAQKVAKLFTTNTQFGHILGRTLNVNFSSFPILYPLKPECGNTINGDKFISGAAQQALNEYNKTVSKERFDSGDRCEFEKVIQHYTYRNGESCRYLL